MNVKALRAFCLVMRHGSLAGAAAELHLSQPAVSRLVAKLEASLRLTLFHRDRRSLRPTREGQAFYREAARILSGVERLPELAAEIAAGHSAQLRVVVMSRIALGLVAPAARAFADAYPSVALTLEMHHRRDMERWLAGRQFDLGFGPLPVADGSIEVEPLCAVPAVAVSHPGAFGGAASVGVEALAAMRLIALTPDTLLQGQIDAIFAGAGLAPEPGLRTSSSLLACTLAADGHGVTITDPFVAAALPRPADVATVAPPFRLEFGTLWPTGSTRSKPALAFRDAVAATAERLRSAQP